MSLEENVLTAQQEAYIGWLCTAPSEREPSSKQKYADSIGVDVTTLRRWEKKDIFRQAWEARVQQVQGSPERTQEVLDTLFRSAKSGDVRAAQLWLQAMNKITPPTVKVDQTITSKKALADLSDEELAGLLAAEAAAEQSRRMKVGSGL